jgi:hypothetical protein
MTRTAASIALILAMACPPDEFGMNGQFPPGGAEVNFFRIAFRYMEK